MLVPCPFRGDHKIQRGRMHGPGQCPPPPGGSGEHWQRKRLAKHKAKRDAVYHVQRGVAVSGIHNAGASSPNRGAKKSTEEKKGSK